jgi:hypothetical protein
MATTSLGENFAYKFTPLPDDAPQVFLAALEDYRNGTIDGPSLKQRIADAVEEDASLLPFKEEHLLWTDFADQEEPDFLEN